MTWYPYMTHAAARKIEDEAQAAVAAIPAAHNRKREQAYERVWRKAIDHTRSLDAMPLDKAVDRDAIHYVTENVGSRRFPHYVFKTYRTKVRENDQRVNLIVLYR